ncbi:MAG: hypothetical protein AAGC45_03755 [Bacteroidota bacterium]
MRKSVLLFFLLIFAIVLWKVTETKKDGQWQDATVEELVSSPDASKIAKK